MKRKFLTFAMLILMTVSCKKDNNTANKDTDANKGPEAPAPIKKEPEITINVDKFEFATKPEFKMPKSYFWSSDAEYNKKLPEEIELFAAGNVTVNLKGDFDKIEEVEARINGEKLATKITGSKSFEITVNKSGLVKFEVIKVSKAAEQRTGLSKASFFAVATVDKEAIKRSVKDLKEKGAEQWNLQEEFTKLSENDALLCLLAFTDIYFNDIISKVQSLDNFNPFYLKVKESDTVIINLFYILSSFDAKKADYKNLFKDIEILVAGFLSFDYTEGGDYQKLINLERLLIDKIFGNAILDSLVFNINKNMDKGVKHFDEFIKFYNEMKCSGDLGICYPIIDKYLFENGKFDKYQNWNKMNGLNAYNVLEFIRKFKDNFFQFNLTDLGQYVYEIQKDDLLLPLYKQTKKIKLPNGNKIKFDVATFLTKAVVRMLSDYRPDFVNGESKEKTNWTDIIKLLYGIFEIGEEDYGYNEFLQNMEKLIPELELEQLRHLFDILMIPMVREDFFFKSISFWWRISDIYEKDTTYFEGKFKEYIKKSKKLENWVRNRFVFEEPYNSISLNYRLQRIFQNLEI